MEAAERARRKPVKIRESLDDAKVRNVKVNMICCVDRFCQVKHTELSQRIERLEYEINELGDYDSLTNRKREIQAEVSENRKEIARFKASSSFR